jgi:hypothetical protein
LLSHAVFPLYVGLLMWGGLWLRNPGVRALLPLTPNRTPTDQPYHRASKMP